ncbi:hypothetical protein Gotri_015324 [Gossypium trilobum]|uniref:Uncharacterized protein n=1 Tax=Gossypium trilobum TaxID=34281 RepID=A0A7J9E117_9ROSI|nr:hypothetical protein [Gossypium trilobum]
MWLILPDQVIKPVLPTFNWLQGTALFWKIHRMTRRNKLVLRVLSMMPVIRMLECRKFRKQKPQGGQVHPSFGSDNFIQQPC